MPWLHPTHPSTGGREKRDGDQSQVQGAKMGRQVDSLLFNRFRKLIPRYEKMDCS